jgi:hypothetical protein
MPGKALELIIITVLALPIFGCATAVDSSSEANLGSQASPVSANQLDVTGSVQVPPNLVQPPQPADAIGSIKPWGGTVRSTDFTRSDELPFVRNRAEGVVPFPLVLNRTVQSYVDAYLSQPAGLKRTVERSAPYMAEMMSVLRDRGLPIELIYLSFAESEFSYTGAGPWQLSRDTARRFGLRVNAWVDERRDPIKSTRAAADYLTTLHEQTGSDWRMTLVAWNNGESGVDRYMPLCDASYDRLMKRLPRRTRALLNRFMAVALIARHHEEFGLQSATANPVLPYRTVAASGGTSLRAIAQREHTSVATLGRLNPALFRQCVPPGATAYPVRVPLEHSAAWVFPTDS